MIYVVTEDKTFAEQVRGTATQVGQELVFFTEEKTLVEGLAARKPHILLLDINAAFLDVSSLVEKLKQDPVTRPVPIVVFGSSLRADLLQDAREAGADKILHKASFRKTLKQLLAELFSK